MTFPGGVPERRVEESHHQPSFYRGWRMAMELVAQEAEEAGEPAPDAATEALMPCGHDALTGDVCDWCGEALIEQKKGDGDPFEGCNGECHVQCTGLDHCARKVREPELTAAEWQQVARGIITGGLREKAAGVVAEESERE